MDLKSYSSSAAAIYGYQRCTSPLCQSFQMSLELIGLKTDVAYVDASMQPVAIFEHRAIKRQSMDRLELFAGDLELNYRLAARGIHCDLIITLAENTER